MSKLKVSRSLFTVVSTLMIAAMSSIHLKAQQSPEPVNIVVDWNKTLIVSRSTPTLQVVTNPMLNPGAPIHDGSFAALKTLGADYVRYVPWLPYPKIAVAELEPPSKDKTSWDFTYIDPVTKDFFAATSGHTTIVNFSTIPAWMFKGDQPVKYPDDPNQVFWNYTQGTELRDPTGKELGDYFGRLVAWYTQGGFTDENGKHHESGYHYSLPYWEVLNEPELEHDTTPEQYTERYDAIVEGIHKVSPQTKFVGLALAYAGKNPKFYEYFLDSKHHKPGIPIDYISYHFYAHPTLEQGIDDWQYTFFDQADEFLTTVKFINQIRDRLSPSTKTDADELGVILPTDELEIKASRALPDHIPHRYWNAAGALYGYLFIHLSRQGVDVIGESQLVGYPSQFPSVSMMDYNNGTPNARYWVLKLIKDNFHQGDKLAETNAGRDQSPDITAQGFVTAEGKKILLLNKRNREMNVKLPEGFERATVATVDEATADGNPRIETASGGSVKLAPFAVVVIKAQ